MPPKKRARKSAGPRKAKKPAQGSLLQRLVHAGILAVLWGTIVVAGIIGWYAIDLPDIRQVAQPERRPAITILADDGSVVARMGDLYGDYVTLKDVPQTLTHAIIAIEDRRFYQHFGIDLLGMARAMVSNLQAGGVVQGGSTLTQQLAKNLFLTPDRTFKRKIQEMMLAIWLEHTFTKDQILTAYLNRVYLGSGTYGVDAAAQVYFNKSVRDINLRESAILAGLLRAPSRYSPLRDPALSMQRARTVLAAMEDAEYITAAQREAAQAAIPTPQRKPGAGGDGRYFADWVTEQVASLLDNTAQDLMIETTLDLRLQRAAERRLDAALSGNEAKEIGQGAVVTMDYDGAVKALVGGRDYEDSQFNRATQARRQPGSAFKPIVYLTAINQGLRPDDVYDDAPLKIGKWSPDNYDGKYRGPVTARQALAESINTVAVRLMQQCGIGNVIHTARQLGVTSPLDNDLSLALGSNLMTPLELTSVYASLATGGHGIAPYTIKSIRTRSGQLLYKRQAVNAPTVVAPQDVATLIDMMKDVVLFGTGKRALLDRPMAGKTGTSSDYRDAWFMGFTGNYVTGVWVGNDDNSPMKKVTGGGVPAQIWHDYMAEAEANLPPRELFQESSGLAAAAEIMGLDRGPHDKSGDMIGNLIRGIFGQ
jgi:penicillin-binding protein 1A